MEINKPAHLDVNLYLVFGILTFVTVLFVFNFLNCWPKRKHNRNDEKQKESLPTKETDEGLGEDFLLKLRLPPHNRQSCTKMRKRGGGGMLKELTTERGEHESCSGTTQGSQCEDEASSPKSSSGDKEHERKKQDEMKSEQVEWKKQKQEEKLRREEEERQKLGRAEEQKPNVTLINSSPADDHTKTNIGLINQGATCYLNSLLQTLFMTEDFRNTVERLYKPIDVHIAQLFMDLKSGKGSAATTERITPELEMNVCEQQDAAEYFQKIMNMVNPEMAKVYQGEFEHKIMCKNPGKEHPLVTRHESFYVIPICMETNGTDSPINMQSCFDSYFEPIKTCEEDQVKCPTCKKMVNTEIKCDIHKLPPVLVVQLERFQLDYYTMSYRKNTSMVEIQFQLSVKDDSGAQHQYDLYAVVKHTGSFNGGHYYAVIKSFEDHQWYEFNDSSVRKIPALKKPFRCNEAYFLLYKQCCHESAAIPNKCDNLDGAQHAVKHSESVPQTVSKEGIKQKPDDSDKQSRNETQTISCPDPQPTLNVLHDPENQSEDENNETYSTDESKPATQCVPEQKMKQKKKKTVNVQNSQSMRDKRHIQI